MEPNISDRSCAALYAPGSGIVCPFGMTIAMAENAAMNGVDFQLNTEVFRIRQEKESFILETSQGEFRSRSVVNAAGVYADLFHNQVSKEKMSIIPRRGEYLLLDKSAGRHVRHTIFMMPTRLGKGVLVSPTVHGNLLLGPTALNIDDKEGNCTTREGLSQIREKASETVKDIPFQEVITSFAGLRAYDPKEDFSIGELPDAPGFIDCAGIQSPGLTSAPAIGKRIAGILREKFHLKEKTHFQAERRGILNPKELSMEERNQLIREKPAYGRIICRCEMISEGEILDAIHRPLGARSLDGLKRRTRAGMGRCQAGFCSPRTMEILSRELPEISMETVSKSGGRSKLILGKNKDTF
jgi:glycerol-3-phosphate dehydrogenase